MYEMSSSVSLLLSFVCLSVCLFVFWSPTREFFTNMETGEGLQILTYALHSWPLSSEGPLTCHTYCDTGPPSVYNVHLRGPVILSPIAERLAVEFSLYWIKREAV